MFYTVHWTQYDGPAEMDFETYQNAEEFFVCLISDCKPKIVVMNRMITQSSRNTYKSLTQTNKE